MGNHEIMRVPFEEVAAGYWEKIDPKLPTYLTDQQRTWLKNYLQSQVAVKLKDFPETRKILTMLDGQEGFLEFEDRHPEYFATMDVIARGKTNRERVRPLFTREDLGLPRI